MATPTPMKHALSQQGRTPAAATPPVSTPFSSHAHAAFSPLGPRSSPQNMKKSPANSATLMGHTASSSGVQGGGAGGPGSNAPVNYDSPAAAAMGALGLDLGGLDSVSISGLTQQLGAVPGRNDDDERARRLRTVLDMLKKRKGRVSEAGLERLAKSMGLECLWEEAMGGSKARTLIIAGSALALEIAVANNIVQSVSVTFPESRSIVLRHVERADKILLRDLQLRPHESPLTKSLDRFAANLESLAVLDRLSVEPGLNLYEAVAGIYETLDRLYRWDLQRLRDDPAHSGKTEDDLAMLAQCTRHGRPTMHEHGHLGLAIDYWKQMRLVRPPAPPSFEADAPADADGTWSIFVGCAPIGGSLVYQPVRVSDKWLSDAVEGKQDGLLAAVGGAGGAGGAGPDLDWLEPENTILPSAQPGSGNKADAGDAAPTTLAGAKLPDVRFNAVFQPPVAIPLAVWHQMNELVGLVPEAEALVTFDALSFPVAPGTQHDPSEPRTIRCDRDVYFHPRGTEPPARKHRHTLFIYKPVYGRILTELPFSHPSQLLRMLPVLRQYAFLATLLQNGFDTQMPGGAVPPPPPPATSPPTTAPKPVRRLNGRPKTEVLSTVDDEFERYRANQPAKGPRAAASPSARAPGPADSTTDRMNMDVVLTVHPAPRLQVVFPFRAATADIVLEIGPNAQVRVVSQNVFEGEGEGPGADDDGGETKEGGGGGGGGMGKGKGRRLYPQDLGRMLEVCEDLGVWCEWIRSRCS